MQLTRGAARLARRHRGARLPNGLSKKPAPAAGGSVRGRFTSRLHPRSDHRRTARRCGHDGRRRTRPPPRALGAGLPCRTACSRKTASSASERSGNLAFSSQTRATVYQRPAVHVAHEQAPVQFGSQTPEAPGRQVEHEAVAQRGDIGLAVPDGRHLTGDPSRARTSRRRPSGPRSHPGPADRPRCAWRRCCAMHVL